MSESTELLLALKAAVAAGKPADFLVEPWNELVPTGIIRAELVRELVVGDPAPSGVQFLHATIEGELDLRNARGPGGGAANTLKLEDCTLTVDDPSKSPGLDACHSHLSRLSLIRCHTTGIHMSGAVIDGDLILEGLQPLSVGGDCWIRARGIRVGGSLNASAAVLRSPRECPSCWKDDSTRYALDLYGAHIGGSLELRRRFTAIGGLRLVLATIGGDLRAEGAHLQGVDHQNSGDRDRCLRSRGADIRGTVFLCCSAGPPHHRFEADGIVDLADTHVGVGVVAYGASLRRLDPAKALDESLTLVRTKIDGGIWLTGADGCSDPFEASDTVHLEGVTVGAEVTIASSAAITMQDASVGGMVSVTGGASFNAWDAVFGNSLDLETGGDVVLKGGRVSGEATIVDAVPGSIASLDGQGLKVGRNLRISSSAGPVDLTNATAGGEVRVDVGAGFTALDAAFENSLKLHVGGEVVLSGTHVAGDATVGSVAGDEITSLTAIGLKVGRDLSLRGSVAGIADFSSAVIGGNLWIGTSDEALTLDGKPGLPQPELRLDRAHVRLALKVEDLALVHMDDEAMWHQDPALDQRARPTVVLRGLRVGTLDDRDGRQWPPEVRLELDGFEYDRTDRLPEATDPTPSGVAHHDRVTARSHWLIDGQYGDRIPEPLDYKPQPFEQLAKVWRSEGNHAEATKITFHRLDLERKVYDGPVFDDGIGPLDAAFVRGLLLLVLPGVRVAPDPRVGWSDPG